jgi:glycosyltransferase involved in cell wall biosynthesis
MASGLPVITSDLAVHREICGDAAVYFQRFSPEALARGVAQVAGSPEASKHMTVVGLERSRRFSWRAHVDAILELSRTLIDSNAAGPAS